jgi:hypothetical protein
LEAYKEGNVRKNYSKVMDCLKLNLYSKEELHAMLAQAGFQNIQIHIKEQKFNWFIVIAGKP